VVLFVEILVILIRLSIERIVKMSPGVHFCWFIRGQELFQHQTQLAQSVIEPGSMVSEPGSPKKGETNFSLSDILYLGVELES
jgi:hypothetical protein